MNRKFKTSKKSRTNYIYDPQKGGKTVLRPGENGVTEADIALLHNMDDNEFDNDRRESSPERFSPLEDWVENKNTRASETMEEAVMRKITYENLHRAIDTLLPAQKELIYKVYFLDMKVTEIARAEGVDESSVRERIKRIHKKLKKFNF